MAIAFYIPDEEELQTPNNSAQSSTVLPPVLPSSANSSAASSPNTINPNEFIQAFYDALYRYTQGVNVDANVSFNCPTCGCPSPLVTPNSSAPSSPAPVSPSSSTTTASPNSRQKHPKRKRLSSIGEEVNSSSDEQSDESSETSTESDRIASNGCDVLVSHFRHIQEQRDRLQEFQGKVPKPNKNKSNFSKQVTATETTAASSSSTSSNREVNSNHRKTEQVRTRSSRRNKDPVVEPS